MGEELLLVAVLLLALYGCTSLIGRLTDWMFRRTRPQKTVRLTVSGHREDLEFAVRAARHDLRRRHGGTLVLVDAGMDAPTRELAERLCRETGITLCPAEPEQER